MYLLLVIFVHFQSEFVMLLIEFPKPSNVVVKLGPELTHSETENVPKPPSSLFFIDSWEKHFNDWATNCFKNRNNVIFLKEIITAQFFYIIDVRYKDHLASNK